MVVLVGDEDRQVRGLQAKVDGCEQADGSCGRITIVTAEPRGSDVTNRPEVADADFDSGVRSLDLHLRLQRTSISSRNS